MFPQKIYKQRFREVFVISSLDGKCCVGIIIIFVIIAGYNVISLYGHDTLNTPDDAITFNSNDKNIITILEKANSSIEVKQVEKDDNKIREFYEITDYNSDFTITGDIIFDISNLTVNGTNNYSKPIGEAFADLLKIAKSTNHYGNLTKSNNNSNFFTDPSPENGGAFLVFSKEGKEALRLNIADVEFDPNLLVFAPSYDGLVSMSNYSKFVDSSHNSSQGNNLVELKFLIFTDGSFSEIDDIAIMPERYNCSLHIILTSNDNDHYCYDVVIPLEIDEEYDVNRDVNYDNANYVKDGYSSDINSYKYHLLEKED